MTRSDAIFKGFPFQVIYDEGRSKFVIIWGETQRSRDCVKQQRKLKFDAICMENRVKFELTLPFYAIA